MIIMMIIITRSQETATHTHTHREERESERETENNKQCSYRISALDMTGDLATHLRIAGPVRVDRPLQ